MDTLESLRNKIEGAKDIKSVVRTMKAVAASNIGQYELALNSLGQYYYTIALGVVAYFHNEIREKKNENNTRIVGGEKGICAIVIGSDQGLVGSFNDTLTDFVSERLHTHDCKKEIWSVGKRVQLLLQDAGLDITRKFLVPSSVTAITPIVGDILVKSQLIMDQEPLREFYIFHNQPKQGSSYQAVSQRLLPLDETWRQGFAGIQWPTKQLPQVAGNDKITLAALIREYLFVSLYKSCAESLASENASRLAAMQRADKNIEEMLGDLNNSYNRTRQSAIDEELFDVVSGFEALKAGKGK
jgi:F-type H+-transporting ATPase subunit gamma